MKPLWLKIVIALGVGAAAATTALTAGALPAVLVGVSSGAAALAGIFHPSPGAAPGG